LTVEEGRAAVGACGSAAFTFVIPVLNEASNITALLQSLRVQFPDAQVIVVDGGSTDDSVLKAGPDCDLLLRCDPGRARQMNCGAARASGDYLLFLHADTRLSLDQAQLGTALADRPTWCFFPVRFAPSSRLLQVVATFMNWRSRLTRVATGDQCLVVAAEVFRELGGYADMPLMEDVELSKRLRRRAQPLVLPQKVITDSRRWQSRGVLRTIVQMWWLRLAYFLGADPARLWQRYYGR
jgi:rSAM/selenodomain-associated transferase 2